MARPGRKRTINRQPAEDPRIVALNQPHRRGMALEWLAEPAGRVLERFGYLCSQMSKTGLLEAGRRFEGMYWDWMSIGGCTRPFANSTAMGELEPSKDDIERMVANYLGASQALGKGRQGRAVRLVILLPHEETWLPDVFDAERFVEGLMLLGDHYGIDYWDSDRVKNKA